MELTRGQRAADAVATFMGSWRFVIAQAAVMVLWFVLNATAWAFAWDPYPFILLNLAMSAEAAFATPLLLMSQNRAAEMDREILRKDFLADSETNTIVEAIADHLGVPRD
jgi:uncharacterized membrane protein